MSFFHDAYSGDGDKTLEPQAKYKIKGEIWLKKFEDGVLYDEVCLERNAVVDGASVLIARLMKNSQEPTNGVFCLAVGTGDPAWDRQSPPPPNGTESTLFAELDRTTIKSSRFIDPITGEVSPVPTHVVDFDFEFSEGRAVGALVEMAIVGGDATMDANSGTQCTYKTFPVINKPAASSFVFTYRLTF